MQHCINVMWPLGWYCVSPKINELLSILVLKLEKSSYYYHKTGWRVANSVDLGSPLFACGKCIEPQLQKTDHRTCAASEDSNHPTHSRSLIRIFTGSILDSQGWKFLLADNEDSDQKARICRLISLRWTYMSEGIFFHSDSWYLHCYWWKWGVITLISTVTTKKT